MTRVKLMLVMFSLLLALGGSLFLAQRAAADATLHTALTTISPGTTAFCIAANVSDVAQDVVARLVTGAGRENRVCDALAPRNMCKTAERTLETSKGFAYCEFTVAPGDQTSIRGSFIERDAAGNLIQLLEAKQ